MKHAERVKELADDYAKGFHIWANRKEREGDLYAAIDAMQSALDDANAKVVQLTADYDNACKLVADMHSAAMGAKVGPVRGLVEDVAVVAAKASRSVRHYLREQSTAQKGTT